MRLSGVFHRAFVLRGIPGPASPGLRPAIRVRRAYGGEQVANQ